MAEFMRHVARLAAGNVSIVVHDGPSGTREDRARGEGAGLNLGEMVDRERGVVREVGEGNDGDFKERGKHCGVKAIEVLETQLGSDLACGCVGFLLKPRRYPMSVLSQPFVCGLHQLVERLSSLGREVAVAAQVGRDHGQRLGLGLRLVLARPDEVVGGEA